MVSQFEKWLKIDALSVTMLGYLGDNLVTHDATSREREPSTTDPWFQVTDNFTSRNGRRGLFRDEKKRVDYKNRVWKPAPLIYVVNRLSSPHPTTHKMEFYTKICECRMMAIWGSQLSRQVHRLENLNFLPNYIWPQSVLLYWKKTKLLPSQSHYSVEAFKETRALWKLVLLLVL